MRAAYRLLGNDRPSPSLNDILREAELSTRAFYRYFPSKDDLILHMYRAESAGVNGALQAAVAGARTSLEALEAWVGEFLLVAYDPRRSAKARVLASAEAARSAGFIQVQAEEAAITRGTLEKIFEQGLQEGAFPLAEPVADARALHALLSYHVSMHLFVDSRVSFEDARDHAVRLFTRGAYRGERELGV